MTECVDKPLQSKSAGSDQEHGGTVGWLVDLMLQAGTLKNLPRTGWRLAGIKGCESVADHSFRVVFIALLLADLVPTVNRERLLRMAILHDLPESLLTDLPLAAVQLLGREAKRQAEADAWDVILPPSLPELDWRRVWEEFEAGETLEARLARAADKLDMVLQAYEYQRAGYKDLDSFWPVPELEAHSVALVQQLYAELERRRAETEG